MRYSLKDVFHSKHKLEEIFHVTSSQENLYSFYENSFCILEDQKTCIGVQRNPLTSFKHQLIKINIESKEVLKTCFTDCSLINVLSLDSKRGCLYFANSEGEVKCVDVSSLEVIKSFGNVRAGVIHSLTCLNDILFIKGSNEVNRLIDLQSKEILLEDFMKTWKQCVVKVGEKDLEELDPILNPESNSSQILFNIYYFIFKGEFGNADQSFSSK